MIRLYIVAGPDTARSFALPDNARLKGGRSSDCELRFSDPTMSRIHFEVRCENERYWLRDFGSRFGTFVNNVKTLECELKPGDVIRAGDTTLRVELEGEVRFREEKSAETDPTLVEPAGAKPGTDVSPAKRRPIEMSGQRFLQFDVQNAIRQTDSGIVFQAHDSQLQSDVALKVVSDQRLSSAGLGRYLRAARVLESLAHPHLVQVYAAGHHEGLVWMSSEFVDGEDAAATIARIGIAGMLDWRHSLRLAIHVTKALVYLAEHHIVHRNINPRSILIRKLDGWVKLGGLGLVKSLIEDDNSARLTNAGEIVTELTYCAPEQVAGLEIDERSDIYSLGATTYAMLTGRGPCEGHSLPETLTKIQHQVPDRPTRYHLSIPSLLEGTVMRMLAKRPADRFRSAADLLRDLERVARYVGEESLLR